MDGAVSEVDKLLTISRLFGVDLNDLLQVERTAPSQEGKSALRKSMHRRMAVAAGVLCAVLLLSNFLL